MKLIKGQTLQALLDGSPHSDGPRAPTRWQTLVKDLAAHVVGKRVRP